MQGQDVLPMHSGHMMGGDMQDDDEEDMMKD
jgi:hypothetical protein